MPQEVADQAPSCLRLPPELRNRIYELLLHSENGPYQLYNGHTSPPILNINRRIRSECAANFYHNITFQFNDPAVCVRWLVGLSQQCREMISEIRYDCSENCCDPSSWRQAFLDLPGMNEYSKLCLLKDRLAEQGVFLQCDVLKAGIRINGALVWTHDPLSEAREAVQRGAMVGRVMFV